VPRKLEPLDFADEPVKVSIGTVDAGADLVDAAGFGARLATLLSALSRVDRCKVKPYNTYVAVDGKAATLRMDLLVAGRSDSGRAIQLNAKVAVEVSAAPWSIAKLEITRLQLTEYQGPQLVDVSALAGVGLLRAPEKERAVLTDLGNVNLINNGGLTVLDWDHDGALDLLVYNVGSLFSLFRNDRRGGFDRLPQSSLIPSESAAMFYVFLDLDNDGKEELVGTEPLECGKPSQIPIYRVIEGRMQDSGSGLPVDARCDDRFVHIAAEDFDGDGLLDLFVSNYGLRKTDVVNNQQDSIDGGRNRFFLNEGALRFRDATDEVGLDRETRRTLLGHWFDYDGDGRRDLYLLNDFADSELYVRVGAKLVKKAFPPLTSPGYSMGISIGDFDGDGDFDVHVSKMFSYAGNRVLAVTPDLGPEKHARLLAMASGDSVYSSEGGGTYRDIGRELHVDNALWAWGSVLADLDNDGDRELWVTNGLATNPDPAAKDAPDN